MQVLETVSETRVPPQEVSRLQVQQCALVRNRLQEPWPVLCFEVGEAPEAPSIYPIYMHTRTCQVRSPELTSRVLRPRLGWPPPRLHVT
eukprot:3145085-Rhodomonas_salina.2